MFRRDVVSLEMEPSYTRIRNVENEYQILYVPNTKLVLFDNIKLHSLAHLCTFVEENDIVTAMEYNRDFFMAYYGVKEWYLTHPDRVNGRLFTLQTINAYETFLLNLYGGI